jgi:ATP adenylyltransferase
MTDASAARLWAPWRSAFISRRAPPKGCVFCAAKRRHTEDRRRHVIARGERVFALLNRYPYNNGHVLVAPYRHVGRFESLRAEEWAEALRLTQRILGRLTAALRPHGFNLGINLGRAAGAGIPGHLHLHLVPRWTGDANFMPLFGGARVISRSLDELYRLLADPGGRKRRRR